MRLMTLSILAVAAFLFTSTDGPAAPAEPADDDVIHGPGVLDMKSGLSAILFALHIVGLGAWATEQDALGMSILQVVVVAVICLVASAPGGIVLPQTPADWTTVVYLAIFPAGLALLGQTWAQAHLSATRTAIVMTTEPVFAALFAVALGGESVTVRMVAGGLMVLGAMLLVEVGPRRRVEGEVPHIAV